MVDMPYTGTTHYGGYARGVDSLSQLPPRIASNLQGYLEIILGPFSDSLTFAHGQAVDLDSKFRADSIAYRREYVLPAYELVFLLKYDPVHISNYYLKVELDQYGQLLHINWPGQGYSDPDRLKDMSVIRKFALNRAKAGEFYRENYTVAFEYNRKLDKLCWVFMFPIEGKRDMFRAISIPWTLLEVVDDAWILESISY